MTKVIYNLSLHTIYRCEHCDLASSVRSSFAIVIHEAARPDVSKSGASYAYPLQNGPIDEIWSSQVARKLDIQEKYVMIALSVKQRNFVLLGLDKRNQPAVRKRVAAAMGASQATVQAIADGAPLTRWQRDRLFDALL